MHDEIFLLQNFYISCISSPGILIYQYLKALILKLDKDMDTERKIVWYLEL